MKYFGYFPQYVNWTNHSYLGPDARTGFTYYNNLYSSLNSARNYDLRENPYLFNEAVGLLQRYSAPGGLDLSGYPSAITSSIPELYKVRNMMYSHFVKERDAGLAIIKQLEDEKRARQERQRVFEEQRKLEEQKLAEQLRVKEEQRKREYEQKVREKNEEKKYWDSRFKNVEKRLDGIAGELSRQNNASKKRDLDFSFFKSDLSGIAKQQDLISQSPSVSVVDFNDLTSDVNSIREGNEDLKKNVSKIQKKINENSKLYESEKQKIQGEIDAIKRSNKNAQPRIQELQLKLTNLEKRHDKTKTDLLGALKEQQYINQTRFEEIEKRNAEQGKVYEKNEDQLRRELVGYEEKANVKFKTLFEYNAYVNKKIQDEDKRKRTTLGAVRNSAQPDLIKKIFSGLSRGRFFDLFLQPAY